VRITGKTLVSRDEGADAYGVIIKVYGEETNKDMHVVGGATLVGSLMNAGSIDEVQLVVNPLLLGGGKALLRCKRENRSETDLNQNVAFRQG
jgi:dihydrofolate reductase